MDVQGSDFDAFEVSFPDAVEKEFAAAYGDNHWRKIKHALATPYVVSSLATCPPSSSMVSFVVVYVWPCSPRSTAVRVNTMRITRDDAITALRSELAPFNAALASESGRTPVEPVAHPQLADVVVIPSAPAVQSPRVAYEPECALDHRRPALRRSRAAWQRHLCARIMSASSGLNKGDRVNIFIDLDHKSTRGSDTLEHVGRKLFVAHGTMVMARAELFRAQRGSLSPRWRASAPTRRP
ncbi:hypothetical protein PINS_up020862 [Pythium insidiosum]|nr:hypothetical protein PINS_up020862 [Pythium insidiosum]